MMIILDSVNVLSLTLHGHPDFWEIVQDSTGVYVECTKCGVDLVHLLPEDWEKHAKKIDHPDPDELAPKVRENKHDHMTTSMQMGQPATTTGVTITARSPSRNRKRQRAKSRKQEKIPTEAELLAAIKEAASVVAIRLSCHEDYRAEKSALISAIDIAESAGCDEDAIREAKHVVDPSYWVCG